MKNFSSIVITGASSGIGEALALDYAAPGVALALTGRDARRLETVAQACREGRDGHRGTVDVAERDRSPPGSQPSTMPIPSISVLANAGISIDKDNSSLDDFAVIRRTLDVNVGGVFNTVEPLLSRLIARKSGQVAVVASLASFIGLPYSASYNASKAAVRVWAKVSATLKKGGIGVSVVCPGFVTSRMTANAPFPMPFLMSSERASAIIRRGLARNRARIAFPIGTKAAVWLGRSLPGRWTARLLGA